MGLNPSNGIAQRMNPDKRVFPNLARGFKVDPSECPEVDATIERELTEAGITFHKFPSIKPQGEVPTTILCGEAHRWGFRRAWYYYIAEGAGIPPDAAEEFHKTWGTQVRVEGDCGCPSPLECNKGFAVGLYHIDTQEGLNAFVKLLASIHKVSSESERASSD